VHEYPVEGDAQPATDESIEQPVVITMVAPPDEQQ